MTIIRYVTIACVALLITTRMIAAQEDIISVPVRAGEHATYSRLVIPAANDLAWELRTFGREAILMLPTDETEFLTDRIFDRIPRTRILNIKTEVIEGDTFLKLRLACDCPVSAKTENGALILDVNDATEPEDIPIAKDDSENAPLTRPTPRPDQPKKSAEETIASNLADRLISQLNQAAEQGIIDLAEPKKDAEDVSNVPKVADTTPPPDPIENRLQPIDETLDGLGAIAERVEQGLNEALGEDELGGSVRITIPEELVQPPVVTPTRKKPKKVAEQTPDPMEHCVEDEYLDVAYWADTRPYSVQAAALNARVFGEFDEPDPDAVLELARFFIFFGLGTEAKSLLRDLKLDQYQSDILIELANTMEGRPYKADGILDKSAGCPGAVALWRTAAVDETETQPLSDTDSLIDKFSELPIQVRRLVGPRLVQSFITRGQKSAANRIFAIVERAAGYHGSAHELKRADLLNLDQQYEAAEQTYWQLVYDGSEVSAEAADALVKSMLNREAPIPKNVLSVLEALAFEYRGSQQGKDLLLTVINAKAGSDAIADAIKISLDEIENEPDAASAYYDAINTVLTNASASSIGEERYLNLIFGNLGLVNGEHVKDATKITISREVMNAGLPNTAIGVIDSLSAPDLDSITPILAEAAWKLRNPATVVQLHEQYPKNETLALLSSRAHGSLGQHDQAIAVLEGHSPNENQSALYWRAGNWMDATESTKSHIKLLAQFMENRTNSRENLMDPANQEDAITQSLPQEKEITLKYVNDVKTQSATIRGFLKETISTM